MYMPCVSVNWDTASGGPGAARLGTAGRPSGAEANVAVADRSSDFQEGRLVGEAARPRTRRMGVRVLQRQLSRRGRFGGDPVGDGGFESRRRGGQGARDSRRRELGDGNAIEGRRLRGLRRRQRFDVAQSSAAGRRGSGDRSVVSRSHRARARDDGRRWAIAPSIRWRSARSSGSRKISRRPVDGGDAGASTISTELSRRCRACARSASISTSRGSSARSRGSSRSRIRTADGARARCRTRIRRGTGAGPAPRRKPRGR